ncbi:MAG: zinc-binding dehydrogenase [Pseudomonadales bacterium]|nr:zinc-binding dehydrogenase [Pseudomonadales bacterium]
MGTKARVVVLTKEAGPLRVEELTLPDPGSHQVLIKQFASGICHSQLHRIHAPVSERTGHEIMGHESTGVVLETGSEVTHVTEGDTVLVTWIPRNAFTANRAPEPFSMTHPDGSILATRNVFTWADNTIADEQYVVKVPKDIRTDVTSIIGCAIMTGAGAVQNTANVQLGDSVAVFGVGGVGLSAIAGAKQSGAYPIIAVDLSDDKLEFAKKFGATHGLNAGKVDPIEEIHKLTTKPEGLGIGGAPISGVDFAFDCIGVGKTMEQIIPAARIGRFGAHSGGTACFVGIPAGNLEIDPNQILMFERRLIGSIGGTCCPERDFPKYLQWYEEGDLDLDAMVTARYPIEQINEACEALSNGEIAGRAIMEFD